MLSSPASFIQKRFWLLICSLVMLSLLLSACGFKLKQAQPLPFNTLYTNISDNSAFGAQLKRLLLVNSPNLRLVSNPEQAEAQLIQESLRRSQRELSLDPSGQVENYELLVELVFSLSDSAGQYILPPTTLSAIRDIPNSPNATEAKAQEINALFQHMEMTLVERLLRRLSASDITTTYQALQLRSSQSSVPAAQPPATATSFN